MSKFLSTLAILLFSINLYAKPAQNQDSTRTSDEHIGHRADFAQTPGQVARNEQAGRVIGNAIRQHGCSAGCAVVGGAISASAGATGPALGGAIAGVVWACERACP